MKNHIYFKLHADVYSVRLVNGEREDILNFNILPHVKDRLEELIEVNHDLLVKLYKIDSQVCVSRIQDYILLADYEHELVIARQLQRAEKRA